MPLMLDQAAIAALIPHAGAMCLLHGVMRWDADSIACVAVSHRDPANPLRAQGALPGIAAVEYAAQAMAAHGGLTGAITGRPRSGYIASLREVACRAERLDTIDGDLTVTVEKLMGSGEQVMYRFRVSADEHDLVTGRAAVILQGKP